MYDLKITVHRIIYSIAVFNNNFEYSFRVSPSLISHFSKSDTLAYVSDNTHTHFSHKTIPF